MKLYNILRIENNTNSLSNYTVKKLYMSECSEVNSLQNEGYITLYESIIIKEIFRLMKVIIYVIASIY